jgi:hypothetical protein
MAGTGAFDKDFGYLLPFMDRVAAAASTVEDQAAREELARLVAEEKARWARIRELLSGAPGRAAPGADLGGAAPASVEALPPRVPAGGSPQEAFLRTVLTVGSLRGER